MSVKLYLLLFTPTHSFISLVERMDILEQDLKHGIQDLKRDIEDNIIRSEFETWIDELRQCLQKRKRRFKTQFAKVDIRFDRWLFSILGLVSYSRYSYSTTFSKGNWLQLIGYGRLGFWLLIKLSPL